MKQYCTILNIIIYVLSAVLGKGIIIREYTDVPVPTLAFGKKARISPLETSVPAQLKGYGVLEER